MLFGVRSFPHQDTLLWINLNLMFKTHALLTFVCLASDNFTSWGKKDCILFIYWHSQTFFASVLPSFLYSVSYIVTPSLPLHLWTFAVLSLTSRGQKCPVCCWIPPPFDGLHSFYHVSSFNKRHLFLLANLLLSLSLHRPLSLSLGISFLSAFYSKSNRKAFIQPKLRDSGYIWPAWNTEMLYQGKRWRAKQSDREPEECIVLISHVDTKDESGL